MVPKGQNRIERGRKGMSSTVHLHPPAALQTNTKNTPHTYLVEVGGAVEAHEEQGQAGKPVRHRVQALF